MRSQKMFGQNQKEFRVEKKKIIREIREDFSLYHQSFFNESQVSLMYLPHTISVLFLFQSEFPSQGCFVEKILASTFR